MRIVTNHWGWTRHGVWLWLRYGWAWPLSIWGVEATGSPRRVVRRVKVGPLCFAWGCFAMAPADWRPDFNARRLRRVNALGLALFGLALLLLLSEGCGPLPVPPDAGDAATGGAYADTPPMSTGGSAGAAGAAGTPGHEPECRWLPSNRAAQPLEDRIVGGTVAPEGAYPWVCALETASGFQFCAATLIGPARALTAAHCQVPTNAVLHCGVNDLRQQGIRVGVTQARNHYLYPSQVGHDLAVLILDAEVPGIPVLRLASDEPTDVDTYTVPGWGTQWSGGVTTPVLRHVSVPWASCDHYGWVGADFCAGGNGLDSCQGDSGGIVLRLGADGWGWEGVGVVSRGDGCGTWPGVYTSVPANLTWTEACAK